MNKSKKSKINKIVDYDLTISDFLKDIEVWLSGRDVRDSTDVADVEDTKAMWTILRSDPRHYVQVDQLYGYVLDHERGFLVKRGINDQNNSMMLAVNDMLVAMDKYYRIGGDRQKFELAEAVKNYKLLRVKSKFERFKIAMADPEKLLSPKQR